MQKSSVTKVVRSVQGRVQGRKVQDDNRALIQAIVLCLNGMHQVWALAQRQRILGMATYSNREDACANCQTWKLAKF